MPENPIKPQIPRNQWLHQKQWLVSRVLVTVLMLWGVLWAPSTAHAQDRTVSLDDTQVLTELGDEDYAVRQAATRRLLQDDGISQGDLDRLFIKCESPEQRHRLLRIAQHHDIRRTIAARFQGMAGSGSMGLSHTVVQVRAEDTDGLATRTVAGVMAALTLPGFPAYATMDPGDVIIEFDGQPIPDKVTGPMFQQMIQARRAGETIDMTVVRNGVVQSIQMTLSNSQALGETYHSGGIVLNSPYREQWAQTRDRMLSLIEGEAGSDDSPNKPIDDTAP